MGEGTRVAAVVLAGGRSRRLGTDKLALEVGGTPLLRHSVDAALMVGASVVVVGPDPGTLPAGVTVVREDPPYSGPYAGVVAGLTAVDPGVEVVLVLAGDLVDPGALLPRLLDTLAGGATVAGGGRGEAASGVPLRAHDADTIDAGPGTDPGVADSADTTDVGDAAALRSVDAAVAVDATGRRQPLLAAYRAEALRRVVVGIDARDRPARALLDGLTVVEVADDGTHTRDVDSPDDLARESPHPDGSSNPGTPSSRE